MKKRTNPNAHVSFANGAQLSMSFQYIILPINITAIVEERYITEAVIITESLLLVNRMIEFL